MALEDRELRSFLVLAEQLHFGRAANLLHISQPALSKQIKGVEEKLGGPLLVRNRRDVRLTAAGTLLYGEARRIVRDLDSLFDATQAAVRGEAGRLRVAVGIATIHSLVPPALLNLVRAGIGVALVPRSARQMRVSGVRFSDINRREAEWDVGVAWHKLHESALVRNFVEICLAVA